MTRKKHKINNNLLSLRDYRKVIYEWNYNNSYICEKTIHGLFEEQTEKNYNRIALIYENRQLTYGEVNEKANQLAHFLLSNNKIKPDSIIGLCLEKNEHMVIAMLAVLKAGAAYIAIDSTYPSERVKYILRDTRTQVVLSSIKYKKKFYSVKNKIIKKLILIDDIKLQEKILFCNKTNPSTEVLSTNLAYVMYTSGTTGKPKGVMVEHQSVVSFVMNNNYLVINEKTITLGISKYAFDGSIFDTFSTLLNSGKLILVNEEAFANQSRIAKLISVYSVNTVFLTTALFSYYFQLKDNPFSKVSNILFGGEKLQPGILQDIDDDQVINLIHVYGPTENITFSTFCYMNADNKKIAPIGKKLTDKTVYILNNDLMPLAIGIIGELYIGGDGVARGYLNQPQLTAKKFIPNPFQTEEEKKYNRNSRLYKTGDLVRWSPDGNIEYIGRKDTQVKIRGYRVELTEIESVLLEYKGVRNAVVALKEHPVQNFGSNKYLMGYYTSEANLSEQDLLKHLARKLPEYMVPKHLLRIDAIPLTLNSKLDRESLPGLEFIYKKNNILPTNIIEYKITHIWMEILGLKNIKFGTKDNFFALGGNSILAIKLVYELKRQFGVEIGLSEIFQCKTIEKLAITMQLIYKKQQFVDAKSKPVIYVARNQAQESSKSFTLSFAQKRLWFLNQYIGNNNIYNVPRVYKLSKNINLEILIECIYSLILRHEVLRTLIKTDSLGEPYQFIAEFDKNNFKVKRIEVYNTDELNKELLNEINFIYNLNNDYPFRAKIFKLKTEDYLSLTIHHIAFDGWSNEILLRELEEYYQYFLNKQQNSKAELNLLPLNIQYADFSLQQRKYLESSVLTKQLSYWKKELKSYETLDLIADFPRPKQIDYAGQDLYFELDEETSITIRELAKDLGISLYTLLLSGYCLMLGVYSNQSDIIIGVPLANRHYNQAEHLIGFFINILPLRIRINKNELLINFINKVAKKLQKMQINQDLPFEKLVEELNPDHDTSIHPIFQVIFRLQDFGGEHGILRDKTISAKYESSILNMLKPYYSKDIAYNIARFEINTLIDDNDIRLKGIINYQTAIYTRDTIKNFIDTYTHILKQFSQFYKEKINNFKIKNITYLSKKEYQKVIYDWNPSSCIHAKTIHRLFEERAEKQYNHVALLCEDRQLTYGELNEKANKLAHFLVNNYQIQSGCSIALCLDRNEYMIIAILAILKIGAIYIAIDPVSTDERVEYILSDARVQLILTLTVYEQWIKYLHIIKTEMIALDCIEVNKQLLLSNTFNLPINSTYNSVASILYTESFTQRPRGIIIKHIGIASAINTNAIKVSCSDSFMQLSDLSSDLFNFEVWFCLLNGAKLYIPSYPRDLCTNAELFCQLLIKNKITILRLNESLLQQLIFLQPTILNNINYLLILAGKAVIELMAKLIDMKQKSKNILSYYVSEGSTFFSCSSKINKKNFSKSNDTTLFGDLFTNRKAYILNSHLEPVPIGAIGELYIGGDGVVLGYLNQPQLTAEKFIVNPFQTKEEKKYNRNSKLYKTDDLARWLPNGTIEYIERNDLHVYFNGYRVDIEDIQQFIQMCYLVKHCIVVIEKLSDELNEYLIGYYTSDSLMDEKEVTKEILDFLKNSTLPIQIPPLKLVRINKMPFLSNDQIDKKNLNACQFSDKSNVVKPRNAIECNICKIWSEILELPEDRISIKHDFFKIGGNSIAAVLLVNRISQKFKIQLTVKDIFIYRTIEEIYNEILDKRMSISTIEPGTAVFFEKMKPLPFQELFFSITGINHNKYVKSFIIKVPELNLGKLQISLIKLANYYDFLQLRYQKSSKENYFYIKYDSADKIKLKQLDINTLHIKGEKEILQSQLNKIFDEWQNEIDIAQGIVFIVGYIYGYQDKSARLYCALHYLLANQHIYKILAENIKSIYEDKDPKSKVCSFKEWSLATVRYKITNHDEIKYWNSIVSNNYNSLLQGMQTGATIYKKFKLTEEKTQNLLSACNKTYNTQSKDLLLTALCYALSSITNANTHYITIKDYPRSQAEFIQSGLETTALFANYYPILIEIGQDIGFSIKNIKESLNQTPNGGIGYGIVTKHRITEMPKIRFAYDAEQIKAVNVESESFWNIVKNNDDILFNTEPYEHNNVLIINCTILDGTLQFGIISKLNLKLTDELITALGGALDNIVIHCINNLSKITYTMSDFKDYQPYIIYNSNTLRADTMFFLPPGNGGAESYINNIVPLLLHKNLVLFNNYYKYCKGKFSNNIADITIEALAEEYIRCMKSIQPKGPYNFFGWSFGGVIAFEMVRQLINKGEKVNNLILLDSYFNFKKVVDKLEITTFQDDISYKYSPKMLESVENLKIRLFKVTEKIRTTEKTSDLFRIVEYITEKTQYNNLDDYVDRNLIEVVLINKNDHSSLISNRKLHKYLKESI